MTDYRSLYDKDFIGAWDLAEGDKTITITRVIGGSLTAPGGRKSKKPVVYFKGSEKGFALNATNGKTVATLYGTHIEKWVGKQITLYKSMTRSPDGSGDVECIRIRPQVAENAGALADEELPQITVQDIEDALKECGVEKAKLIAKINGGEISELDQDDLAKALAWIRKQKKAA